MSYSPIIVIAGPTAVGKTKLAVKLAQEFSGYVINADSRQIYKELEIGTARPSKKSIEKTNIPHYLFGYKSIDEKYNIYEYQKEVREILQKNHQKPAFLVGGTGLYIDSVVYNYELKEETEIQRKKRELQKTELEELSVEELQKMIGKDIEKLNESDRNNPRRLIRLIQKDKREFKKGKEFKHLYLVYYDDFEKIERNIKKRIDYMFKNGLIEENIRLKEKDFVETIGYREFEEYFQNKIDLEEVKKRICTNTRQYAKRQITWFKRNKNAVWVKDYDAALKECTTFLI